MRSINVKHALCAVSLAFLQGAAQNNYIPGLSPTSGNIGVNLPSPPFNFNFEVGGSIGMGYGAVFGVTNQSWPSAQRKIFETGWDPTNFDFLAFYTPGSSTGSTSEKMRLTLGGKMGLGTSNPQNKLSVETSVLNDGINVTQTTNGASALHLNNTTSSGKHWAVFSTGNGNSQGAGHFSIYDYGASADRFFIDGTTGNTGIGTILPGTKLHVVTGITPLGQGITYSGTRSDIMSLTTVPSGGAYHKMRAFDGRAAGVNGEGFPVGVYGEGSGGATNYGGHFTAFGGNAYSSNYGVLAEAKQNNALTNIALFAEASGATNGNYAGWFNGIVFISGGDPPAAYPNTPGFPFALEVHGNAITTAWTWFSSDKRFKDNIKPITSSLEKIKKINGYNYTYRTDEFKEKNFNSGNQMGFMAQELKEVFPELVVTDKDGYYAVNYIGMIPVMLESIKEQDNTIQQQAQQIKDLTTAVEKLNAIVNTNAKTTTGLNELNTNETMATLEQNIPNPFSGETVIKYTLPQQTSKANLIIYDLTGKQITSIPVEKGSTSITLTSERLQAGIYIYSLVADNKILDSKRMVVAEK